MKTETILKTTSGLIQHFASETTLVEYYNRNGKLYEVKDGVNGRELWHKGHKTLAGVVETIPART